jgi:hypothetical protein
MSGARVAVMTWFPRTNRTGNGPNSPDQHPSWWRQCAAI